MDRVVLFNLVYSVYGLSYSSILPWTVLIAYPLPPYIKKGVYAAALLGVCAQEAFRPRSDPFAAGAVIALALIAPLCTT